MKILVVDDHQLFLDGLQHTLMALGDNIEVIAVNDPTHAMRVIDDGASIDLILLDMVMPGLDGPTFLRGLAARNLLIPTVAISAEMNPQLIKDAMQHGALGYIPKSHSATQMLEAVRSVIAGNVYLPSDIARVINQLEHRRAVVDDSNDHRDDAGMTRRQYEVLQLMAKGYSNKTIADALHVSERTVKSHVTMLFQFLTVKNRTECVTEARRRSLLKD